MKKTILIVVGIVLILLIMGVWAYLFMYGAPKDADEVFTRFGFGNSIPEPGVIIKEEEPAVDVSDSNDTSPERLRQLTLQPVAGAVFTELGILYAEEGTGHIYHIDLDTGEEKLLSGTTIPGTYDAVFSPDGSYVALSTITDGSLETIVGFVDTLSGSLKGVSLPLGARDIAFNGTSSTLFYLLPSKTGSAGYSYNIEKKVGTEIFKIPLRDVQVLWGNPVFVYTTPSAFARGHLYRIIGNQLTYVTDGLPGLTALRFSTGSVITGASNNSVSSQVHFENGTTSTLSFPLIPEKCVNISKKPLLFFCAIPKELGSGEFPDEWYMGKRSYNDSLFQTNLETNEWNLVSDPVEETGRELDVSKIGTDEFGELIYLINKNDNTLWMFDTTLE